MQNQVENELNGLRTKLAQREAQIADLTKMLFDENGESAIDWSEKYHECRSNYSASQLELVKVAKRLQDVNGDLAAERSKYKGVLSHQSERHIQEVSELHSRLNSVKEEIEEAKRERVTVNDLWEHREAWDNDIQRQLQGILDNDEMMHQNRISFDLDHTSGRRDTQVQGLRSVDMLLQEVRNRLNGVWV